MMEVLGDPKHEEHAAMREWVDDDWDLQRYDVDSVDKMLAPLAASWKRAEARCQWLKRPAGDVGARHGRVLKFSNPF